jgi:hypothetical protein
MQCKNYSDDFYSVGAIDITDIDNDNYREYFENLKRKYPNEKKKAFLSFAYGVWVTAYARNNLLRRIIALDEYVLYADTDSIKLKQGYDINIINKYNDSVRDRIKFVSNILHIDESRYAPLDIHGVSHMLGVFESETKKGHTYTYDEFITQGAKKYAYKDKEDKLHITVSGVPKSGAKSLKGDLNNFRNDLVFEFKDTGKNLLIYTEDQEPVEIQDYLGNKETITDKSGCCILPTTYILGKSQEYEHLLSDESAKRAIYKE